jgi:hypothetical protein
MSWVFYSELGRATTHSFFTCSIFRIRPLPNKLTVYYALFYALH